MKRTFETVAKELDRAINQVELLRTEMARLLNGTPEERNENKPKKTSKKVKVTKKRKGMSASVRKVIGEKVRARWAEKRAKQLSDAVPSPTEETTNASENNS